MGSDHHPGELCTTMSLYTVKAHSSLCLLMHQQRWFDKKFQSKSCRDKSRVKQILLSNSWFVIEPMWLGIGLIIVIASHNPFKLNNICTSLPSATCFNDWIPNSWDASSELHGTDFKCDLKNKEHRQLHNYGDLLIPGSWHQTFVWCKCHQPVNGEFVDDLGWDHLCLCYEEQNHINLRMLTSSIRLDAESVIITRLCGILGPVGCWLGFLTDIST